jgi:hypothetical protein
VQRGNGVVELAREELDPLRVFVVGKRHQVAGKSYETKSVGQYVD